MNVEDAQKEAERRWGKYGFAWIDGSLRYEVGFFDGDGDCAGVMRIGNASNFEDAFEESDSEEAYQTILKFFPVGAKFRHKNEGELNV